MRAHNFVAKVPRVVVQPDFSVILIGLNPAPVAELAPFCERVKGRAGSCLACYWCKVQNAVILDL